MGGLFPYFYYLAGIRKYPVRKVKYQSYKRKGLAGINGPSLFYLTDFPTASQLFAATHYLLCL